MTDDSYTRRPALPRERATCNWRRDATGNNVVDMSTPKVYLRTLPSPMSPWLGLLLWILLCAAAAIVGGIASMDAPDFYARLDKPSWAPPAGIFGPVWTVLYLLMALSAWLVWRERGWARARGALGLFVTQLAFNTVWSWLFFAWHRGALAFADILVLWMMILATTIAFARIRQVSAWLLVPYLAWVSFATALNYSVWQRNPPLL